MDDRVGRDLRHAGATGPGGSDRTRPQRGSAGGKAILLILIALAAAGLYWRYVYSVPPARQAREVPPQAVRDTQIAKRNLSIRLNALGTVTPLATVTLRTQISGRLQKIGFEEGQMVKKGDFLAQIDPRPYQVALEQVQGQRAKDQALLDQAKSDFTRYQTLNRQDSIARQQVDNQGFLVRQYESALMIDDAMIDSAKLNLSYCTIISPIDGRVGLRQVDVGSYVQSSDSTGIVVVTQLQPISVTFTIPEDALPAVARRIKSGDTLPVTVSNRANTETLATGRLLTTDNQIDPSTGTIKLRAAFDNTDETLFPQQFVNVQLLVDTLRDQVTAPIASVQRGSIGTFVYVIKPDSTVTVRPITLGVQDGEFVAITKGLEAGEHVVIDGIDRLREGASVVVRNAPDVTTPETEAQPQRQRGRRRQ